ncbi:MAG: hypothetical protein AB7Q17_13525 [Phycisphaerae bacterium]
MRRMSNGLLALSTAVLAASAAADVPRLFNYQGKLAGYTNEVVSLQVSFWNASSGGSQLFTETHTGVTLQDGVFAIRVGSNSGGLPTSVAIPPVFIGLAINGGAELTPRTRLVSVPFAFRALGAEALLIPGSTTAAATVDADGHVVVDGRVEMGATGDGGGLLSVRNAADLKTVELDGEDSASGGRVEVYNGVANSNVATVVLDGNEAGDSRVDLFDANGFDAIRLHADLQNDAPELSLFAGAQSGQIRETVQIAGNFDPDATGAGEVRLRRVDASGTAVTTAILAATSDTALGDPGSGGYLQLNYQDGSPVFTVKAGAGTSAIVPASMELRNVGSQSDQRFVATTSSLALYNTSNDLTAAIYGSSGSASFDGDVTIGGTTTTGVLTITGGSDLSERFDIRTNTAAIEAGVVVCIDPANPGKLLVSEKAYDRTIAGVISGAGGVNPGMVMSQTGTIADGKLPVALTGRVWVRCDASAGGIEPGDLLTTADAPGCAMKVTDHARAQGAVLGKAMSPLAAGERGLVLVLVNLQ